MRCGLCASFPENGMCVRTCMCLCVCVCVCMSLIHNAGFVQAASRVSLSRI